MVITKAGYLQPNNFILQMTIKTLLTITLLAFSIATLADTITGKIVGVRDGDTVTLLTDGNRQVKIRLNQIDAPESNQAFGQRSKQALSDMIFNKTVQVETTGTDKYRRTLGTIFIDGLDVNREQIRRGMAWAYRKYLSDTSLLTDEQYAKQARVGLWVDPNPMAPWDFRHGKQVVSQGNGNCGLKRYCKQMSSCEEATRYLKECGLTGLDKDGDGVPCEKLCRI